MKVSGRQTGVVGKLNDFDILDWFTFSIVGKGAHTPPPPPFSKIPSFLQIQDVPSFYRSIKKKVLNDFF